MRVLILDTYYPAFLQEFGALHPELSAQPYAVHWRALMDECFGTSDFYSHNLGLLEHEGIEIVANCELLQRQWAAEHGLALPMETTRLVTTMRRGVVPWLRRKTTTEWFYAVLRAQVNYYRPDVLYVQDMNTFSASFIQELSAQVRLVAGQTAYPLVPERDYREYDIILSSFPHYVKRFRQGGMKSAYLRIGFEPRVLSRLRETKRFPVVFVGGLSPAHTSRTALLETVAATQRVDFWGYGERLLSLRSPLRSAYHGKAWGLQMYNVLYNAGCALNQHISVAEDYANNMRLYEATGVGTLLITDEKTNLRDLFDVGEEIVAFRSPEECSELASHYRTHENERAAIAKKGQARTLREHTYLHRMQELIDILQPLLRGRIT